jgi:hypothetical protein
MLRKALAAVLLVILPACAQAQSVSPDLHGYQSLLDRYVRRIGARGEPFDTRFDYEQLYVDENIWKLQRSERLEQLHAQLLAATPSAMTPAERLAWGINTYNFLVIERITVNLLVPKHGFQRYKAVDQINALSSGFFTGRLAVVEGRSYTLDSFQRRFVFGDSSASHGPRALLADPRVLFATNPGRIGAPPLMPRAYRADSLDHQLDEAVRVTLALPRFVTVQANPTLLLVSDWLARNRADLGGSEEALLAFVQKNAPRAVRDGIRKAKLTKVSRYVAANPLLNQMDHPKIIMPVTTSGETVSP